MSASTIRWRTGGLDRPGRADKFGLTFGDGIEVVLIGGDRALSPMLATGELDAIVTARARLLRAR